jgi:hypothetical protein
MKRLFAGLGLAVAVTIPASVPAQTLFNGTTYTFCGGTGYTFCGMANLTVQQNPITHLYHVALVVANTSGSAGSRTGAEFVAVGLDNVLPNVASGLQVFNFAMNVGTWNGSTFSSLGSACAAAVPTQPSGCWNMSVLPIHAEAGGIKLDFDASTTTGNPPALSSLCGATDSPGVPRATSAEIYTCGHSPLLSSWRPIEISFDMNQNLTSAEFYVKAIDKTLGSTECVSVGQGTSAPTCIGTTTTTPEPASLALLGSGLLALAGRVRLRRRGTRVV